MTWEMWLIGIMPCVLSADQMSYLAHVALHRVNKLCVISTNYTQVE